MVQPTRSDDRVSAAESKFYLPAGVASSFVIDRLERLWAKLFSHGIEPSR